MYRLGKTREPQACPNEAMLLNEWRQEILCELLHERPQRGNRSKKDERGVRCDRGQCLRRKNH